MSTEGVQDRGGGGSRWGGGGVDEGHDSWGVK